MDTLILVIALLKNNLLFMQASRLFCIGYSFVYLILIITVDPDSSKNHLLVLQY